MPMLRRLGADAHAATPPRPPGVEVPAILPRANRFLADLADLDSVLARGYDGGTELSGGQ